MATGLERNLLGAPTEEHQRVEIYSGVARLSRTVWASEVRVAGTTPDVAVMLCHPTANFLGHYALPGLAERGLGAIGFTTRYVGNDTSLIMENCLLDMGAMVRYLYERGYKAVVLVGNSGGASIVPYYQAQARQPTITDPPGGGPDLTAASLRRGRRHRDAECASVPGDAQHRVAGPRHRRRGPGLRTRPVVGHVQHGERAALLARVRLSLPRERRSLATGASRHGHGSSWASSALPATARPVWGIWPSSSMARRRTCDSSMGRSIPAIARWDRPSGALHRWPTTCPPASAG